MLAHYGIVSGPALEIGVPTHYASHKHRPPMVPHCRRGFSGSYGKSALDSCRVHRVFLLHRAEKRILYQHAVGSA